MRRPDDVTQTVQTDGILRPEPPSQVVDLLPGSQLAERFVVRRRLGSGATGTVFEALDTAIGQKVAVKLLRAELNDHASRERLRREVRSARPGHPNLVTVFDLHTDSGRPLLSMELVVGASLRDELLDRGVLPWHEVVGIGRQAAAGLAHLHDKGIVHRDVKPGNILVTSDGTAKVCDLGLARPAERGATVTETAMVMGTPAYMAPEQARHHDLTSASDIYSLGLTLARALTGAVPLEAETAIETLMLRQRARPPRIRRPDTPCPKWLDRLIRRMLEPNPKDRPSARQVTRALERGAYGAMPSARVIRQAAIAALGVMATTAVVIAVWDMRAPVVLDAESVLQYTVRQAVGASTVEISDSDGNLLRAVDLGGAWRPDNASLPGEHRVVFGDFNGDHLQDAVVSKVADPTGHPLAIYLRQADGSLSLAQEWSTDLELAYGEDVFTGFRAKDIVVANFNADDRDEIVMVLASSPFYPAAVRIADLSSTVVFTLWHPGVLRSAQVGDRDADGRLELYLGGTCNFLTPRSSNTSAPVAMAIETDWGRRGREVSLFAPDRKLASTVPAGVELYYLSWPRVNIETYHNAWQHALVQPPRNALGDVYLSIQVSQETRRRVVDTTGVRWGIRDVFLDRHLAPVLAQWEPSMAEALNVDPTDPSMQALLETRYWNGEHWQVEPAPIRNE